MMAGAMQVAPDYAENGRIYYGDRKRAYMFPCDEVCSIFALLTMMKSHMANNYTNRLRNIAWTASTNLYTLRAEMCCFLHQSLKAHPTATKRKSVQAQACGP